MKRKTFVGGWVPLGGLNAISFLGKCRRHILPDIVDMGLLFGDRDCALPGKAIDRPRSSSTSHASNLLHRDSICGMQSGLGFSCALVHLWSWASVMAPILTTLFGKRRNLFVSLSRPFPVLKHMHAIASCAMLL